MAITVIWIDREQAKIFHLFEEKMERAHVKAHHHEHHSHSSDNLELKRAERIFFASVSPHLQMAASILLLGPGVAKHHFQQYLAEHEPKLSRAIVGCETVDHPTDAQITAYARKFLKLHPSVAAV